MKVLTKIKLQGIGICVSVAERDGGLMEESVKVF